MSRRWVVFDYGKVISEPPSLDALATRLGVPEDRFAPSYWGARQAYDHGTSDVEYWRTVGRDLGVPVSEELAHELTGLDAESWLRPTPEAVELIVELAAADVPLALLSNAPASFGKIVSEQPWTEHFRHLVFSGDLGVAKPSPAIWEALAARLGTRDCVFFDDRRDNVDGAVTAGLIGVWWQGAAHARDELVRLGLLHAKPYGHLADA
ncbi:putative hydrolase of the HAD superfamily [Saccharothrix tamanrassetensis]|uniref:Putative hydrolase of the HAD superfamily n=1 Tax=Saccharothrix tamanrassetensis TaxID=1051531 RepID=A0A841CC62_9PSEU|nr:HAD family phosphatase [Saccharothrix tamanrassetensis]MBB5954533.1 putative hydrolase of the HAD superfamily [Saccharothrix tamanrassetensis]